MLIHLYTWKQKDRTLQAKCDAGCSSSGCWSCVVCLVAGGVRYTVLAMSYLWFLQ